ncbi:MAG: bifunctional O-acetylhomoserine aminocarboxypropyltransferase/cysteine synthase [Tissierellia bacterium]|jgi:O-acetylhomoserine (thiol)-lyase|nr:PLP-dependent transferase [Bacillota bacterium]NLK59342.1 bifunctional O-acetylhomoserine aminocarboxypropyltransferase/cysteine synthase [Tissierellia bacterium]
MNSDFLRDKAIETQCVQAGYYPENQDARVMPIVQSTTYKFDTADELGDVFDLKVAANMYTRLGNPTLNWLEEKIAVLEGGVGAVTTSSGQSANLFAIINITKTGEHVIAMSNLYGGTHTLLGTQLKKFGIDVEFVDPHEPLERMKQRVRRETRLVFAETLGNPALDVLDFAKVSELARFADVPLVVDNTFPTPYLCKPFEFGANIVTHSTTKYMDGHATSVGGVVVDGGNFNWDNGKYPELTTPDLDYHGLVYTESFGPAAFIAKTRAGLLRDIGATMSPMNAFLTNLGLETLHLRMERHSENALRVAKYLEAHEKVEWVNYPGLESSKDYELAQKYLPKGCAGIVSFGPKGGSAGARKVIDTLQLATLVTHVGDIRTHTIHPASTTHRQLSEEQLIAAGVKPDLIRLNVGIENIDDILADLEAGLAKL